MKRFLNRFGADENGATAIEYGLIAALVFLVIVGAVTLFGNNASDVIITSANAISDAAGG